MTVGPALLNAVLGPDIVRVLSQEFHQLLHLLIQRDCGQVQRGGFVAVRLQVTESRCIPMGMGVTS